MSCAPGHGIYCLLKLKISTKHLHLYTPFSERMSSQFLACYYLIFTMQETKPWLIQLWETEKVCGMNPPQYRNSNSNQKTTGDKMFNQLVRRTRACFLRVNQFLECSKLQFTFQGHGALLPHHYIAQSSLPRPCNQHVFSKKAYSLRRSTL